MQATTLVRTPRNARDKSTDPARPAAEAMARPPGGLDAADLDALDAAGERLGAVDFRGVPGPVARTIAALWL